MAGEKSVLSSEQLQDSYHGICFSGNVACFGKNWVSQFINTLGKPFFIDPMTYVIQHNIEKISKDGELKRSYVKLANEYGEPFDYILKNLECLNPSDFDANKHENFTNNVLQFQRDLTKPQSGTQKSLLEYAELLGDESSIQVPEFLVVPYFWFDTTDSDWYKLNLKIMKSATKYSHDIPVYGVICTELETIQNPQEVSKLVADYNEMDGVLVWISKFNEYQINEKGLISFLDLLNQFKENNIILMYGSYFSIIASKFGLNGISPGVGISEYKSVKDQPTGGVSTNKYYIPQPKIMTMEADARSFYIDNISAICTCDICNENKINSIDDIHHFFDSLTSLKAKQHYCMCKSLELREIETSDIKSILSILSKNIDFCEHKIGTSYKIPFHHLYSWQSSIRHYEDKK